MTEDELNPYEQGLHEEIERLEAKLSKAISALDEAIYMLAPDESDMKKKAGIYRIVTAYEELKGIIP